MKKKRGYTVLELLMTVSILTVLTGISLISFASPRRMLEKETVLGEVSQLVNEIQLEPLWQGKALKLSFTPWTIWRNDEKALEFPKESGWQWKGSIKDITLLPDSGFNAITNNGEAVTTPQEMVLTYNQTRVAALVLDPVTHAIRLAKASEDPHDTCPD